MSLLDEEFYEEEATSRKEKRLSTHFVYWGLAVILFTLLFFSKLPFSDLFFPIVTGGMMGYLLFMVFGMRLREWYYILMLICCLAFTAIAIYGLISQELFLFGRSSMFFYILGFALAYLIYRTRYRD